MFRYEFGSYPLPHHWDVEASQNYMISDPNRGKAPEPDSELSPEGRGRVASGASPRGPSWGFGTGCGFEAGAAAAAAAWDPRLSLATSAAASAAAWEPRLSWAAHSGHVGYGGLLREVGHPTEKPWDVEASQKYIFLNHKKLKAERNPEGRSRVASGASPRGASWGFGTGCGLEAGAAASVAAWDPRLSWAGHGDGDGYGSGYAGRFVGEMRLGTGTICGAPNPKVDGKFTTGVTSCYEGQWLEDSWHGHETFNRKGLVYTGLSFDDKPLDEAAGKLAVFAPLTPGPGSEAPTLHGAWLGTWEAVGGGQGEGLRANMESRSTEHRKRCRQSQEPKCDKNETSRFKEHGGGRRCQEPGCDKKSAQGGVAGRCSAHGGGKRCQEPGCVKGAVDHATNRCIAHGGGKRCQEPGCNKSSQGPPTNRCIAHGGGKRCQVAGCDKGAQGGTDRCKAHGGGKRCQEPGCSKESRDATHRCFAHGGGKRCQEPGCSKSTQGPPTNRCKAHGGGKRFQESGCSKCAIGATYRCRAHGAGKRCQEQGCIKGIIGATERCRAHSGGRRCHEADCDGIVADARIKRYRF